MKNLFDAEKLNNVEDFEESIAKLSSEIDRIYDPSEDNNPLAGYFGAEHDELNFVVLPELDAAFERFGEQTSLPSLLKLVGLSFKSVDFHNFLITAWAVQEIIERDDIEAQKQVIALFKKATTYYDFGHRVYENTILDALYDDLFGRFATAALLDLLTDAEPDMLTQDGADIYFAVAAKNSTDEDELEAVLSLYLHYLQANLDILGADYFDSLNDVIRGILDPARLDYFEARLSTLSPADDEIDFTASADIVAGDLAKQLLPQGADRVVEYLNSQATAENQAVLAEVAQSVLYDCVQADRDDDEVLAQYIAGLTNKSNDFIYLQSFKGALKEAVNYARTDEKRLAAAARLTRVAAKMTSLDADYVSYEMDPGFQLNILIERNNDVNYEVLQVFTSSVFPLLKPKMIQKLLFLPVTAATLNRDPSFLTQLQRFIPDAIDNKNLAYKLAGAAAVFGDKASLLAHTTRAIELGRTQEEFLQDEDFESFRADADFLAALA